MASTEEEARPILEQEEADDDEVPGASLADGADAPVPAVRTQQAHAVARGAAVQVEGISDAEDDEVLDDAGCGAAAGFGGLNLQARDVVVVRPATAVAAAATEASAPASADRDAASPTAAAHAEAAAAAPVPSPAPVPQEPSPEQVKAQRVAMMFTMARQQNFATLRELLKQHPQHWTERDEEGHTLLHWAALVGSTDFAKEALEHGVDPNVQAQNKQTPLMWATLRGHLPVMKVLLDTKAKVDLHHRDSLGATALMIAIQHRSYRAFLLLMARGGEKMLSDADNNGCTGSHWAAYKGDLKSLQFLDYFGADMLRPDNAGMLPVHRATCASEVAVIEFLVEKRSDLMSKNKEGKTCIDIADENQSAQLQYLFKRLLKKEPKRDKNESQSDLEAGGGGSSSSDKKKDEGLMKSLTKDKVAQKMFPAFWLICVSMAMFQYLTELRATSYDICPVASLLFELGVPISLIIFFSVALGDPGKVPKKVKGRSGVEELMKAIDGGSAAGEEPDINRLCTTTWVLKDLRTKYCTQTEGCVEEFDHYCVWLNNSIGKGNHRQFVALAFAEWFTQLAHIYVCFNMMRALVEYNTFTGWLWGVLAGYPLMFVIFVVQCFTAPWVLMLIIHQSRLVIMNLTTNEIMNMHRYDHFWSTKVLPGEGRIQKQFVNPFSKGGAFRNCLDFWWYRNRSLQVQQPEPQDCCSGGHGHGGHSHGHSHGHDQGHSHGGHYH